MHNIKLAIKKLAPSQGIHATVWNQYIWRTEKKFIGDNEVSIADIQEPIWWNRPLDSDVLCKQEEDGLYSYNLPFWEGDKKLFKTSYNVLLNRNSVPVAIHIQLDETWTEEQKEHLDIMFDYCLYRTLIDIGVCEEDLNMPRNDFYIHNRKFACGEKIFEDNVFTQNVIVTLRAEPEREIFNRLKGTYALAKPITGILEEIPNVTKEEFISILYAHLQEYVQKHFN